jgi:hypothetical protein
MLSAAVNELDVLSVVMYIYIEIVSRLSAIANNSNFDKNPF